jgi:hypothetical protein
MILEIGLLIVPTELFLRSFGLGQRFTWLQISLCDEFIEAVEELVGSHATLTFSLCQQIVLTSAVEPLTISDRKPRSTWI